MFKGNAVPTYSVECADAQVAALRGGAQAARLHEALRRARVGGALAQLHHLGRLETCSTARSGKEVCIQVSKKVSR
jgi:hypothetical protein